MGFFETRRGAEVAQRGAEVLLYYLFGVFFVFYYEDVGVEVGDYLFSLLGE